MTDSEIQKHAKQITENISIRNVIAEAIEEYFQEGPEIPYGTEMALSQKIKWEIVKNLR